MVPKPMSDENQALSLAHGITEGIDVPTLALRFESALDSLSVIQEEAALARLDAAKQAVVSALAAPISAAAD